MAKSNGIDILGELEQYESITELHGGDSGELPNRTTKKTQNKGASQMAAKKAKKQNKKTNKPKVKSNVKAPQLAELGGGGGGSYSTTKSKSKKSTKKLPKKYDKMTKVELYEYFKDKGKSTTSNRTVRSAVSSSQKTKDQFKNPLNILIETGAKEFRPMSEIEAGGKVSIKIDELFGLYAFVYKYVSKVFKKYWIAAYNIYQYFDVDELKALRKGYGMPAMSTTGGALTDAEILNYVCSDDAEEKTLALINESPSSIVPTIWKQILFEFMNWTDYAGIVKLPEEQQEGFGMETINAMQENLRLGVFEGKFIKKFKQFLTDEPTVKLVVSKGDAREGYNRQQLIDSMLADPENKAVLATISTAFSGKKYDDYVDYGDDDSTKRRYATTRAAMHGMPDDYAGSSNDQFGDISANEMADLGLNVDEFLEMSPIEKAVMPMANMQLFGLNNNNNTPKLGNLGNSDTRFTDDIVDDKPHHSTFAASDEEIEAEIEAAAALHGIDEPSGFMDNEKGFDGYLEDADAEVIDKYM